ncbi:hypothetical protein ACFYKX_11260 [Cytobacillus sp. FJAT-54145]|uniref:Uncharacterized protein n=1 Tax=Cytobacillus spartinae TaxID=3299023 RepID=A0ABW6KAD6_9BACI
MAVEERVIQSMQVVPLVEVKAIIEAVSANILEVYEEDPFTYLEDGFPAMQEDTVFQDVWESLLQNEELFPFPLAPSGEDLVADLVWEAVQGTFLEARESLQAFIQEGTSYQKNPLAYVGMRQSDFI